MIQEKIIDREVIDKIIGKSVKRFEEESKKVNYDGIIQNFDCYSHNIIGNVDSYNALINTHLSTALEEFVEKLLENNTEEFVENILFTGIENIINDFYGEVDAYNYLTDTIHALLPIIYGDEDENDDMYYLDEEYFDFGVHRWLIDIYNKFITDVQKVNTQFNLTETYVHTYFKVK